MQLINVSALPKPAGHYSHALIWRDMLFASGQLPVRPDGSSTAAEPFEVQARQVLANIQAVLEGSGSSLAQVLKTTVYIVDVGNWPKLNEIYAEVFGEHRPARSVVPVPALHYGYLIEVEIVAILRTC